MVSDVNISAQKRSKIAAVKKVYHALFSLCSLNLKVLLPPLPEVQYPNFLDFPNPWGKTNEKKWSQIWILLLIRGVKSPRNLFLIFDKFCLTSRIFLVLVLLSASVERCLFSRMRDFGLKLKMQVSDNGHYIQSKDLERTNIQSSWWEPKK